MPRQAGEPAEKPVQLASLGGDEGGDFALPGVRKTALFEIKRKSGLDDDSDVDLHEDEDGPPVQLASAAGLARLAPNGLLKQRESVDVACLKPSLVRMLKTVERHYGKKMVVTSGYRSPALQPQGARRQEVACTCIARQPTCRSRASANGNSRNSSARCPAAAASAPIATPNSVHIDVGPERDWNWRCRRRKSAEELARLGKLPRPRQMGCRVADKAIIRRFVSERAHRLAVRTPPFHGGNRGSIPLGRTKIS